jgi:hypothetical protein
LHHYGIEGGCDVAVCVATVVGDGEVVGAAGLECVLGHLPGCFIVEKIGGDADVIPDCWVEFIDIETFEGHG